MNDGTLEVLKMFKSTFDYKRTGDANTSNLVNVEHRNAAKLTKTQEKAVNVTVSTSNKFSVLENDVMGIF